MGQVHYSNLFLGSVPALKLLTMRYDLRSCQHWVLHWEGIQHGESQRQAAGRGCTSQMGWADRLSRSCWSRVWGWMNRLDTQWSKEGIEMTKQRHIQQNQSWACRQVGRNQKIQRRPLWEGRGGVKVPVVRQVANRVSK